ncbi:MAG: hypothetical protein HOP16_18795 [Acidobacteria bacterium]|nr:hypothetical protein [Acidobacteriota bacterium]
MLADALYREEVARARAMSPAEKLLEGPRLFDRAYRLMADGVRYRGRTIRLVVTLVGSPSCASCSSSAMILTTGHVSPGGCPQLDWGYLGRWTAAHGTTALLAEIRTSVPLV